MTSAGQIDPQLQRAREILSEIGFRQLPPETLSLSEARRAADAVGEFLSEAEPPLPHEYWSVLPGPHGPLSCRVYPSEAPETPSALVYFHGGGFALGCARGWDGMMRNIVRNCGVTVISVDYRRTPESRFPVAFDEAVFVMNHISSHHEDFAIDPSSIAMAGDSAGANLALAAACELRDRGEIRPAMLLLFYGIYSCDAEHRQFVCDQSGLSAETIEWMWEHYLPPDVPRDDWRVAPLSASFAGLPFTYLVVGELDPLVEDNRQLQLALAEAGVEHALKIWPGVNHGFIRLDALAAPATRALDDATEVLRQRLGSKPCGPVARFATGQQLVYQCISLLREQGASTIK